MRRNASLDVADMGLFLLGGLAAYSDAAARCYFSSRNMPFLPQCRSRVCWALLLHARRTPKQNLGCTTGNCNLLVPLVVARVIRPLSWISFTACIVQGMFTLTCMARPGDGLCRNMMLAMSPDCDTASLWIGCCRDLGGKCTSGEGFDPIHPL